MKYGDAPLDADKYAHAHRYRLLIEKQLARVEITCEKPGATVTMDGQTLFTAPGHYESLVRVGQHTIVATQPRLRADAEDADAAAGQKETVALALYTDEQLTQYRRRWSNALPWSVLGAGVAIAGVGGILQSQAIGKLKAYDSGVSTCSIGSPTGGCMPSSALASQKSSGESHAGGGDRLLRHRRRGDRRPAPCSCTSTARGPIASTRSRLTWTPVVGPTRRRPRRDPSLLAWQEKRCASRSS